MKQRYFDYAATTPTDPEVVKAMEPYFFERFGNASSPHTFGRSAKKAIEDARQSTARFLNAGPEEIVFTSGGTESNNHAIIGAARALRGKGSHIIATQIEHHSVLRPLEFLEKEGFCVTYLKVDRLGIVDPKNVAQAITDKTILVIVMHASNEIGTVQEVGMIGRLARERGIAFHVDAVQTVGHVPVDVEALVCTTLSLSGHKFYGPKGVGALYVKRKTPLTSFLLGGDQERGRRASTQNVPGAVGLARALELCHNDMSWESGIQIKLRDKLIREIPRRVDGAVLNGHPERRLPNNAHFSFEGIESESLLLSLDAVGIAASMGSACTSGAMKASHVLLAIGLTEESAFGSLRLSIGRWTTEEDIDHLLNELPPIIQRLRAAAAI